MPIRQNIEKLALWYIIVFLIGFVLSSFLTPIYKNISPGGSIAFVGAGLILAKSLSNLVVAIWLYGMAKQENGRQWLWFLFGIAADLFAPLIYIGLKLYEQHSQKSEQQN